MYQTLLGLGLSLIGLLLIVYSEPLARMSRAISKRTYSLAFPLKWGRAINILSGSLWLLYGLLVTFHLTPAPWSMFH
jgi:hypothetical protein